MPGVEVRLSHAEVCEAIEAYVRGKTGIVGALGRIEVAHEHGSPQRYLAVVQETAPGKRGSHGWDDDGWGGGAADSGGPEDPRRL